MLDFRYAKNIRKLLQIEQAQQKMKDFNLVMEMIMTEESRAKLEALDRCKGIKIDNIPLCNYVVGAVGEEASLYEFVCAYDSVNDGCWTIKYRHIYNKNTSIMVKDFAKKCVKRDVIDLEEGRTIEIDGPLVRTWTFTQLYSTDWTENQLGIIRSLGFKIVGISHGYYITDMHGDQNEEDWILLEVSREETENTEK